MINTVLIPAVVIILMVIVGSGLTPKYFSVALHSPGLILATTLFQLLILPFGALILILLIKPQAEISIGLFLVAAAPGGALSNYYCHFAQMDTAFSVILTASSSVIAFVFMPVILSIGLPLIMDIEGIDIIVIELIISMVLILLLPIMFGMLLRHLFTNVVQSLAQVVKKLSMLLVVLLLALIIIDQWETTERILFDAILWTCMFTAFSVTVGWLFGLAIKMDVELRYVTVIEFAVRNAGIAAVVATVYLWHPEYAAFSALFVVIQFPLIFLLINFYQRRLVAE